MYSKMFLQCGKETKFRQGQGDAVSSVIQDSEIAAVIALVYVQQYPVKGQAVSCEDEFIVAVRSSFPAVHDTAQPLRS
jgi:hypothetical protein